MLKFSPWKSQENLYSRLAKTFLNSLYILRVRSSESHGLNNQTFNSLHEFGSRPFHGEISGNSSVEGKNRVSHPDLRSRVANISTLGIFFIVVEATKHTGRGLTTESPKLFGQSIQNKFAFTTAQPSPRIGPIDPPSVPLVVSLFALCSVYLDETVPKASFVFLWFHRSIDTSCRLASFFAPPPFSSWLAAINSKTTGSLSCCYSAWRAFQMARWRVFLFFIFHQCLRSTRVHRKWKRWWYGLVFPPGKSFAREYCFLSDHSRGITTEIPFIFKQRSEYRSLNIPLQIGVKISKYRWLFPFPIPLFGIK